VFGFVYERFTLQYPLYTLCRFTAPLVHFQQTAMGADQRVLAETMHIAGPIVRVHDDTVLVQDHDAVGRVIEECLMPLVGLAQFLGPFLDHRFQLEGVDFQVLFLFLKVVLQSEAFQKEC